ncbi:4Fe-4S double cluster binding domain-containing protein [Clostridium oryzae]|uniref:Epoxyqueuosine reductase n=1 Tax=Clostridium oryzae TaxID=1450648 RepID=A0A1V4I5Q3_9CLOT|nr:4Fe-4S double cluster binding domain-containing protein [Clostridium oryzae]OPJ55209.1 epoxyqueuosine reductase [Clostridium oryzae]
MFESELINYLKNAGADIVGFGDLTMLDSNIRCNLPYGICVAVKIASEVVKELENGPTEQYYEEYKRLNKLLDKIVSLGEKFIKARGYNAIGQSTTYVTEDDNLTTPLPHKTVATRAGIGWIGKNALLITSDYGSAIRISTILTDIPVKTGQPIDESKCGNCLNCTNACPAEAIKGNLWNVNAERKDLIEPLKCRAKARAMMKKIVGIETAVCGKCIAVCPFTKAYIKRMKGQTAS